jgi:CHASE2 domain-containing sensor protein
MRTSLDWLHEQEHAGVALSLLVALTVSALSVTGALRFPDGAAYDGFVAVMPAWERTTPRVLLLEAGREEIMAGDPIWLRLLSELRRLGASQIVFGFVPEQVSRDFFEAAGAGDVVLGRSPAGALAGTETPRLLPLPAAAAGKTFPTAVAAFAPPRSGVYRYQLVKVALEGGDLPALEALAAQLRNPSGWRAPEQPYLVNFNDGVDRLPIMRVRQALEGELVPELVAGRSVLVAPGRGSYPVGLDTPGAGDERPLSPIEFHGYALETLLAGRTIATLPPNGLPALLAVVALVNLWLYQRAGLRFAGGVTAALFAVYVLCAYAALGLARVWVPFVEAVLVLTMQGIALMRRDAGAETRALVALLGEVTARVREWVFPASVHDSPEPWVHLAALVHQTLDLERVIFFERVRRRHRAREVHSLGCALTDIAERRRDYERTPYTTAIAEQGPIRVDSFLTPGAAREEQFLAPWLYGGEVVGFWAIGVDPDKKAEIRDFDALLRDFGNEIAALVSERLESSRLRDARLRRTLRWLHPEGRRRYGAVAAAATLVERRLGALEQVLNHLSTAAVFYDLFGRVILANRPMMDLTGSAGIPIYDVTALDLVMILTGKDIGEARRALRRVIVERVVVSLPAALPGGRHDYVLGLAPIDREAGLGRPHGERTPFELDGVLCELLTVSALRKAYANKERMMARSALRLRDDFGSIITHLGVLESEDTAIEARRGAIKAIHTRAEDATRVIDEAERWLAADLAHDTASAYPVDLKAAVEAAVRELTPLAESRQVLLETGAGDFIRLVFAEPGNLMTVIRSMCLPVIQDSIEQGRVEVRLSDSDSWITLELKNAGFGIPNDRLQEYLHGQEALRSEEFRRLRQAARRVSEWGGALEGESQVGVGLRFTLRLRPYL